jgi:hypothetical protein
MLDRERSLLSFLAAVNRRPAKTLADVRVTSLDPLVPDLPPRGSLNSAAPREPHRSRSIADTNIQQLLFLHNIIKTTTSPDRRRRRRHIDCCLLHHRIKSIPLIDSTNIKIIIIN